MGANQSQPGECPSRALPLPKIGQPAVILFIIVIVLAFCWRLLGEARRQSACQQGFTQGHHLGQMNLHTGSPCWTPPFLLLTDIDRYSPPAGAVEAQQDGAAAGEQLSLGAVPAGAQGLTEADKVKSFKLQLDSLLDLPVDSHPIDCASSVASSYPSMANIDDLGRMSYTSGRCHVRKSPSCRQVACHFARELGSFHFQRPDW